MIRSAFGRIHALAERQNPMENLREIAMPAGWMHAVIDLIAYDRPYLEIHQWKDAPARWLGVHHRAERHDWYNAGKAGIWSLTSQIVMIAPNEKRRS